MTREGVTWMCTWCHGIGYVYYFYEAATTIRYCTYEQPWNSAGQMTCPNCRGAGREQVDPRRAERKGDRGDSENAV